MTAMRWTDSPASAQTAAHGPPRTSLYLMKSWHLNGPGVGLDGLTLRQREIPNPGRGEVLLRVHATSLNYREILILKYGRYPLPVKPDAVALCDGAGEVVA